MFELYCDFHSHFTIPRAGAEILSFFLVSTYSLLGCVYLDHAAISTDSLQLAE